MLNLFVPIKCILHIDLKIHFKQKQVVLVSSTFNYIEVSIYK